MTNRLSKSADDIHASSPGRRRGLRDRLASFHHGPLPRPTLVGVLWRTGGGSPVPGAKAEPLFSPLHSTDRKPAWTGSLGLQGQRS